MRVRLRARLLSGLVILSLIGWLHRAAIAEDPIVVKRMWFGERGGMLITTTSFTQIIDKKAYDQLSNGFDTIIVARIYVYRKGTSEPISYVLLHHRLIYDLWDEAYVVRTDGPSARRTLRFKERTSALKALTEISDLPIAPLADIPRGEIHYMGMVVELNPVSDELMAEMRRWLTKPAGSATVDRSSSFFGSFVSVFVNPKISQADRVRRIHSQPFFRKKY